jgi:inward rectifier potassium channel
MRPHREQGPSPHPPETAGDRNSDLGFGAVVAQSRRRLLNRDGSFNVARTGLGFFTSLSLYHYLLTTTWPRFLGLVSTAYLAVNTLFAGLFLACGPGALTGIAIPGRPRFLSAFFFSVQTLATIGYGVISPVSLAANLLVTTESLVGMLGVALSTGLVFARFSRPNAKILFSRQAVISPYQEGTGFMFRMMNARTSQLIEVGVQVLLSRLKGRDGSREFRALPLERDRVAFFPLSWTVVHPIDDKSPLFGVTATELAASEAEFLVLVSATEETFSQVVHTRSSYRVEEVIWGARFVNVFNPPAEDGTLSVDVSRLDELTETPLPRAAP